MDDFIDALIEVVEHVAKCPQCDACKNMAKVCLEVLREVLPDGEQDQQAQNH